MRPRRALAVAAALTAGTCAGCGGGGGGDATTTVTHTVQSSSRAFVVDVLGRKAARPTRFGFSVNGDLVADGLHWSGWGTPTATGSGTFAFNPAPHTGTTSVPGELVLTGLKPCGGASYYTHAGVDFQRRPPFQPQLPRLQTPCD